LLCQVCRADGGRPDPARGGPTDAPRRRPGPVPRPLRRERARRDGGLLGAHSPRRDKRL